MATASKSLLSARRNDVKIMVEILNIVLTGARKTEIVYRANLNFRQVQKYLDFLTGKGLIFTDISYNGKKIYRSTERGKTFVRRYNETAKLLA